MAEAHRSGERRALAVARMRLQRWLKRIAPGFRTLTMAEAHRSGALVIEPMGSLSILLQEFKGHPHKSLKMRCIRLEVYFPYLDRFATRV